MLRAIGAYAVAFCTFFITSVSASYDTPVDMREVVSAGWDLAEVSEQMTAAATVEGLSDVAHAAQVLHNEAYAWYDAVRHLGDETRTLAPDQLPDAHEALVQAYENVAGYMDGEDAASAELRTLWRMTQTRMRVASRATHGQADSFDR